MLAVSSRDFQFLFCRRGWKMFKISSIVAVLSTVGATTTSSTSASLLHHQTRQVKSNEKILKQSGPQLKNRVDVDIQELLPSQLRAKYLHDRNFIHHFLKMEQIEQQAVSLSTIRELYSKKGMKKQKILSQEEYHQLFPHEHHPLHQQEPALRSENLRVLKSTQPNNFFTISFDSETDCSSPESNFGYLVNYCYTNNDGTSFLYKVNKKENLLIQLTYPASASNTATPPCHGVPDKIVNENLEGTTKWGQCVAGTKYTYYSEFPHPAEPVLGIIQSLEENCSEDSFMDLSMVIAYDLDLATTCKQDTTSIWKNLDLTGCSETGTFVVNYYINNPCTSDSIAYQETYTVPMTCYPTYPMNNYPHPENWVFQYYCGDPSGSTSSPPPITPTCNYPNLYYYIGNGECEPEYNTEGCDYDGGDCCVETCNIFSQDCPVDNTQCVDPEYV
jgi:hypothetical protein